MAATGRSDRQFYPYLPPQLKEHQVQTIMAADLPLIHFDAVLIERVLCNLLENAAKYTPAGSRITLSAETSGADIDIRYLIMGRVCHRAEKRPFEKFTRGERSLPNRVWVLGWPSVALLLKPIRAYPCRCVARWRCLYYHSRR
jgi:K+-sensing histidine kinase KdpD